MSGFWCRKILALAVVLSAGVSPVVAEDTAPAPGASIGETLSSMERTVGVPAPGAGSLSDRLSALEMRVFGTTRKGSLVDRTAELERALTPAKEKQDTPEPKAASPSPEPAASPAPPVSPAEPPAARAPEQGYARTEAVNFAQLARPADLFPPRFVRIDPPGGTQTGPGDYFGEVMRATKNKVLRFKTMPIPVYITPYQERGFTEACIRGFEDWEARTGEEIRFVQVDDPEAARIRVIWTHLGLKSDAKGCTLGAHTMLSWKSRPSGSVAVVNMGLVPLPIYIPKVGPKYSVPPQVIEVNLSLVLNKEPEVRYALLENVVAHELGHALGLLGHSPNKNDLMYPVTDEHSRLSPRDIKTVLHVYGEKVDIPL